MGCMVIDATPPGGVVLCQPTSLWVRTIRTCPVCGHRHRWVGYDQMWYGITWTCLGCGDMWCGEELLERPFRPRWRRDNIAAASAHWGEAVRVLGPEHRAWTDAQMADMFRLDEGRPAVVTVEVPGVSR